MEIEVTISLRVWTGLARQPERLSTLLPVQFPLGSLD